MRIVIQRVTRASVDVGGDRVAAIGRGLLALVGVARDDGPDDAERLAAKTAALRLFPSDDRGFDRTVGQVGGAVLVVSQFTLLGDARRGNRPSWSAAAAPDVAAPLVLAYEAGLRAREVPVRRGVFGADMAVELCNDGPVTLVLDSRDLAGTRRGS